MNLHSLRHIAVSRAIAAGVDVGGGSSSVWAQLTGCHLDALYTRERGAGACGRPNR